jgi:ribosome maturation factor RimP
VPACADAVPPVPTASRAGDADARQAIESTVTGLGYELVDVEREARAAARHHRPRAGQAYPSGDSEFVTVDDCELVTRQLQYALEVDGVPMSGSRCRRPGWTGR